MVKVRSQSRQIVCLGAATVMLCGSFFCVAPKAEASIFDSITSLFQGGKRPQSASGSNNSGGVRGGCPAVPQGRRLTALSQTNYVGLTTEAYPTFWFYNPFRQPSGGQATSGQATDRQATNRIADEAAITAEFVLKDEQGKPVMSSSNIPLPKEPGLVSFKLAKEPGLVVGKRYNWFFAIACSRDRLSNPFVSGWISRLALEPTLQRQIKATLPQDRYVAYFQNEIWYDAVNHLAEHRTLHLEDWQKLLELFNLADLATTDQNPPVKQIPQANRLLRR